MFCWKCGVPLMDGEKYCPKCNANQNLGERDVKKDMLESIKGAAIETFKEATVSVLTEAASKGVMRMGRAIKKKVMKKKR